MIEWSRVQDLRNEVGVDDFDDIIAMFLEETDGIVNRLPFACDPARIARDLHFLMGSALNLGFVDLALLCQSGERQAAAGSVDIPLDAVAALYRESRIAFLQGLKSRAA